VDPTPLIPVDCCCGCWLPRFICVVVVGLDVVTFGHYPIVAFTLHVVGCTRLLVTRCCCCSLGYDCVVAFYARTRGPCCYIRRLRYVVATRAVVTLFRCGLRWLVGRGADVAHVVRCYLTRCCCWLHLRHVALLGLLIVTYPLLF